MNRAVPPRFLHERLDEGEVWVDLEAGRMYGLNETATAILEAWQDGLRDPQAIARRLEGTYDLDPQRATGEIRSFLDEARRRGFLDA